ncbi:MAG TPA: hypothetical protein VMT93_01325 [Gemmatimonadaceae bacterium]|nr:hypothetical protein [Gemmatimonadaceae bacterium]
MARGSIAEPPGLVALPYTYPPAIRLAFAQNADGLWNNAMLAVPAGRAEAHEGIGTIVAARRLLEWGWDRESPPLALARRTLFRLLAEDEDPAFLYELAPKGKIDPEVTRVGRGILREAAAAVLAQAGYENDPRLRGAARRIVARLDAFLRGPSAAKPFIRVGNQHVLAPGAAPPSVHTIMMLAHMPLFRNENWHTVDRLYAWMTQPVPRATAAMRVGRKVVEMPHLVMGDPLPHRNAADADTPAALWWLEILARLGFLRRNENWGKLFDRFLDDRDARGLWEAPKRSLAMRSTNPFVWASFPLEPHATADDRVADVTFRLGLIARITGRTIVVD